VRIAIVSPYDLSVPGGVQGQVRGLSRVFAWAGHEVLLIAPGRQSASATVEGVRLERAGRTVRVPVNGSRAPIAPWPAAMLRTRRLLKAFAPEVIHVHEPFVPGAALAAVLGRRVPTVATFHRAGASRSYRAVGPLFARAAHLDRRVVVSLAAADTLGRVIGARARPWTVLANGIDLQRFARPESGAPRQPTVLFVGRHEARKGLEILIEAFAQLPAVARLRIAGQGPQSPALRRATSGDARITWLGAIDDEQVADELVAADLFVAPSLAGESFGVVLLEAMAAGTPVIASDLDGYRLAGGGAARYVPAGEPLALRAAIVGLLDDEPARLALQEAGLRQAERHSLAVLAERYLEIFDELTGHARDGKDQPERQ
jgi:phosphatidylinositol alpha-mannosyltransferase